ncbi:MAG: hypothetical protein GF350_15795 [Chitinivibrionales bacterium]|nr:hypothetical protein [Chitinivibrionales bacterium]
MSKFSIAFVTPEERNQLRHRILDASDQDAALRKFFSEEVQGFYSEDDQGFYYFKEDFFDKTSGCGNIINIDQQLS